MNSYGDGTRVVHAVDAAPGEPFGAQPVFASVYHLGGQNTYGRTSNPTWSALETALGALDGGECVVFPSGMAAISTMLRTLLSTGDTLMLPSDGYYLSRRLASEMDINVVPVPTAGPYPSFEGVRLVARRTVWPWADSRSTRAEPIWPLAPVTRVVVIWNLLCVLRRPPVCFR